MQNLIIGNDSEFCECEKEPKIILVLPTPDGKGKTINGELYEEPPDFCPVCAKPNAERLHITFNIKPSAEMIGEPNEYFEPTQEN